MPGLDVDGALAFLQKTSSTNGDSVYQHLTNVIQQILEERPTNAVDLLETSVLTKRTQLEVPDLTKLLPVGVVPKDPSEALATLGLYSVPEPVIDVETGEPEEGEPPNEYETENLLADAPLLEAVGVGLGRMETYQVMLALKKLGEEPARGIATIRFFGKIFGVLKNYYIFEGTLRDPPGEEEEEEDESGEAAAKKTAAEWGRPTGGAPVEKNVGANAYVYWVCNQLGGAVQQLPEVTPLQVKTARTLKKFFTGELKAEVSAYPPFPGVEENFLRAQIARIAATTVVCPANFFKVSEEDPEVVEKNEEFEPPAPAELESLEGWVHRSPHLKKQGRCAVWTPPPPEGEEGEEEAPPLTEEEQEEGPALLTSLDNDGEMAGGVKPWAVISSSSVPGLKFKVNGVRSVLWPGATAISTSRGFCNIYVGWGFKNVPYVPPPPPEVAKEYDGELIESMELPPPPGLEPPEGEEGEEGAEGEEGEEEEE